MEPRVVVLLIITGAAVVALHHFRDAIAEAWSRGPWNSGGPPPTGPAAAADPFAPPFARWKARETPRPKRFGL